MDICEERESEGEIFHKLDIQIVIKACYALQQEGKAEVFSLDASGLEGTLGVKFFHHG